MREYQLYLFSKPEAQHEFVCDIKVGDICSCKQPCPERMITGSCLIYGYMTGCYNYWATVEVIELLAGGRAICKNIDGNLANHNGWTIVPVNRLGELYNWQERYIH